MSQTTCTNVTSLDNAATDWSEKGRITSEFVRDWKTLGFFFGSWKKLTKLEIYLLFIGSLTLEKYWGYSASIKSKKWRCEKIHDNIHTHAWWINNLVVFVVIYLHVLQMYWGWSSINWDTTMEDHRTTLESCEMTRLFFSQKIWSFESTQSSTAPTLITI